MENQVQLFEHAKFGKVRVVVIDGEIHFVAADICRTLELKNPTMAMKQLNEDERAKFNLGLPYGEVNIVNEPGLYRLIFASRKKEAREFQRWVYHEVLPAIRKTGSYSAVAAPSDSLVLPNSKRSEAQLADARVYVLLMSNNTVKIGLSGKLRLRVSKIKRDNNLTVKDIYFSPLMSREDARLIEWACQEKFSSRCMQGEFFSASFEEACAAIDNFVKNISLLPNASKKFFISTNQIVDKKID